MELNDTESARILSRVRKMMNLAGNAGATEGERDNALRMAHATLAKYNLELVAETAATGKANAGEAREQQQHHFMGYPWARSVAMSAANLFFCMYYYATIKGTANVQHNFIGRHSNVVTAHEMARYLVESIHREARAYQRATYPHQQSQYTGFATGAAHKIYARCTALRANSEKPVVITTGSIDRSMSLAVVYQDEDAANKQFLTTVAVKLQTKKDRSRVRDQNARAAGSAYGDKLSLNRQVKHGVGRI